ncbi:arabinofuranosidase catalytic domain-containing protein [Amycolatopsis sp. NEAU-NG30]|uniref:Arabinofuranosidase catalytic domain-containing protein n=1 Tax=Amycolatopsis melonis TaxID=3156488 RepID=A0ABV0L841_9PSEU
MVARRVRRLLVTVGSAVTLAAGAMAGTTASSQAATQGPCDIYAAGATPCVAAHSTTRALYGTYNGPLYQVRRSSDNTTRDIGLLSAGGVVNAAAQDSFCAGTTCLITVLYDQSGRGNHLTQAPPGTWPGPAPGGWDNLADATAAPVTVGGQKAYGVYIAPGTGYRNNKTNGVATGDQPEGIYAVVDGVHYNNWCCFDYGNAQTTNKADAPAIMETVYFGADRQWGYGDGPGPWVMADLEWGLFSGVNAGHNTNPTVNHRFVTAIVKGEPNHWAIRSGDAQSGGLTTVFDGPRPSGYHPMKKQGAILLGIGGDNSVSGAGTFYEGVLTADYPTAATESAVQANITAAGYSDGRTGATTGPLHAVGAGKCLDVPNSSTGTQLQIRGCTGQPAQNWTRTASNQLTVTTGGTTLCLDASGGGTTAGTKVITWSCTGQPNQQWNLNSNGTITGVQSGLCLDVTGASTADGAPVELWTCNGGSNQRWTLG